MMALSTLRIVRIACHPKIRGQGLGQSMVASCHAWAKTHAVDYLSVSYGLTPFLFGFWRKCGFSHVRLGFTQDHASGVNAIIGVLAIAEQAGTTLNSIERHFAKQIIFGAARYFSHLGWRALLCVMQACPIELKTQSPRDRLCLLSYADNQLQELECQHSLFEYVSQPAQLSRLSSLEPIDQALVMMRIIQGRTWADCCRELGLSGKKAAEKRLQLGVKTLLQRDASN